MCDEGLGTTFWSRKTEVKTEVGDAKNIFIFSEKKIFYADLTFIEHYVRVNTMKKEI
jgi:hypothetical protein